MKKMKKLFAILMTMAMVMGLGITGFAAIDGASIEVKGLSTDGAQEVTIYEIYRLDDKDNGWVKAGWVPESVDLEDMEEVSEETLDDLVEASVSATPATNPATNITTGTVTFNGLQAGAYLVIASDSTDKVTYNAMIAKTYEYGSDSLMTAKKATVVAKASEWTTEKTIIEDENNDQVYQVGDVVKYQIETIVPHNNGGATKVFNVTDTLTNGTYYFTGEGAEWNVKVNGEDRTSVFVAPTPTATGSDNQETFTLDLSSLLTDDLAGKAVVITYTVKVDGQVDEMTNTVKTSHDTDGDTVTAYTGQMTIKKLGEKVTAEESSRPTLEGATFVVYEVVNGGTAAEYRNYATFDDQNYVTGWVKVNKVDSKYTVPTDATPITTGTDGTVTVKGLDVGTYYFHETVAPDGYSLNAQDSECIISKTDTEGVVEVKGSTEMTDTKLSALPETGGMGTTLFTIAGCVIMISAAGLFFATRKKAN